MKKLAALLASFTIILGTQSVMAEELTAEEIVDPFRTPVEGEYPVFEGTVACFVEKYNTGPFIYDISESEIIAKNKDGTIEGKYTIKYRSQNFLVSYKPVYTPHFTATDEQYKSERQLENTLEIIGGWGTRQEPNEAEWGGYYLYFEFLTFNTKTLEMRTRQGRLVGGTREDRDTGLLGFYKKCVIIP
jgi:hypothetical protein